MYNILKSISEVQVSGSNQFAFTYARKDFANLYNEVVSETPHIFLDPVIIDTTFSEFNTVESYTYSGTFMLVVSSDIDVEDYDTRYQTYIKPLLDESLVTIKNALVCSYPVTYNTWRTQEIINIFDYNLDGIIVTYNITVNV